MHFPFGFIEGNSIYSKSQFYFYFKFFDTCLFCNILTLGIDGDWLEATLNQTLANTSLKYHTVLVEKLMQIIHLSSQPCEYRVTNKSGLEIKF